MQRLLEVLNKSFTLQTDIDTTTTTTTSNINLNNNNNNNDSNDDTEDEQKVVPSREIQYKKLNSFINKHIKSGLGNSLYVCGQPGTGKSLTLTTLAKNLPKKKCKTIYINCMALSQPSKIYIEIYRRLGNLKSTKKNVNESLDLIESNYFYNYENEQERINNQENKNKEKSIILILDEVDVLIEKYSSILYKIFEWPFKESSKLILFGIANDLSLVENSLPRFAKIGVEIEVLQFKPYTESQILNIIQSRLQLVVNKLQLTLEQQQQLFEEQTLEYISKQISSNNCDIRKAFDIIRRLVCLKFEHLIRDSNDDDSLEEDPNEEIQFPLNGESIFTMDLVLDVISEFFESKTILNIKNLPTHAQLILFSSFLSILNYKTLYESYKKHCSIIDFTPIQKSDFGLSIDCITSNGLMTMVPHKLESNRKITLNYSKDDLFQAFDGSVIFSQLLQQPQNN